MLCDIIIHVAYFLLKGVSIVMRLIPIEQKDVLLEIGKKKRVVKIVINSGATCYAVELSTKISIGELVKDLESNKPNDFYFSVEE